MRHLLTAWPEVSRQIKGAGHILLLLDYDGTLTPIVERPELANLPEETKRVLQTLAGQRRFTLGIISGRALTDLKKKVGLSGIIYAGNHGLEIEGPEIEFINPLAQELRPVLRLIHEVLRRALRTVRGVIVEDKGLTLSIHYRQVEEEKIDEVHRTLRQAVSSHEAAGAVKITGGKKVYEVRPHVAWDKGKAIGLLLSRYARGGPGSGVVPVYVGDDVTDEDGFRVIEEYGDGLSVFVGAPSGSSAAGYFLKSPAEVETFLRLLLNSGRGAYDRSS
ncbi:MAG: trehalose-phosphatase [Chloroflexi bacterium]|nr:trehalose-phosphatase [Chloroflexota bacterium]